jgi:hypothetical protein
VFNYGPVPQLSTEQIREMAREAERENLSLPPADRRPRGWHFRRAAIRLGLIPLPELTVDEVAWYLSVVCMGRVGGV